MQTPESYTTADGTIICTDTIPSLVSSLKLAGTGASRRVYFLDSETVIKFDLGNSWAGNCSTEIQVWNHFKGTEVEQHLAPVLAGDVDGGWLIMRRAAMGCATSGDYKGDRAADAIDKDYLYSKGVKDLHGGNVGWLRDPATGHDVPVVIDYAFNVIKGVEAVEGDGINLLIGEGADYEPDPDECECSECLAGTQTRAHKAGTACGHEESCSQCYNSQERYHAKGTTCCHTDCEMCYPYGRYCQGAEDCNGRPDIDCQMPNGDTINLCGDCQPNTAFYKWVHAGPTFHRMNLQLFVYDPILNRECVRRAIKVTPPETTGLTGRLNALADRLNALADLILN